MKAHVRVVVMAGAVLLGAACGRSEFGEPARDDNHPVVVRTATSIASLLPARGELAFSVPDAMASADGGAVYAARRGGGRTTVRRLDPRTGKETAIQRLDGELWIRAVSADGQSVALLDVPPLPGDSPYPVRGRESTEVVVAEPATGAARRVPIAANVEPEAFTIDRTSLFVVDFHPPMAPDRYRVRSLDLATGTLNDVFSADKELQEDMRGTARTQAWSADGKRLYTLYTLEGDEHGEAAHAFIHVLDLDARWAHCIDLPAGTGIGESGIDLTVSPDGHTVFLADSTASTLVEVDAVSLRTTRTAALPGDEDATPTIAVDAAGRVLVASGSDLHTLDARNLRRVDTATLEAPITALQSAGDWIIAALGSELVVLDRAGQLSSRVRLPSAVTGIGTPTDLDAGRQRIECAC